MDRKIRRPTRRNVLAALGAGTVSLAGCLTSDTDDGQPGSGDDPKNGKEGPDEPKGKGTDTPANTDADTPGNGAGDEPQSTDTPDSDEASVKSVDAPGPCPAYDDAEHVICYDAVEGKTGGVPGYLEPSTTAFEPGETVEFTLHNTSERTLNTNFYDWRLHKRVDGEWYSVAPQFVNQPLMMLRSGETHTWSMTVQNDGIEAGTPVRPISGTGQLRLTGVGGGHYAFRARGWFEGQDHETDTVFAATLDFEGESLSLTPSNAIQETAWDGQTLVAESNRGKPDDEDYRLGAYELERVETTDADRSLITEQVLRESQLRDTVGLALEHDADRVRLEEYNGTHPIFGSDQPYTVEYQGETFRVTSRVLSEGEGN